MNKEVEILEINGKKIEVDIYCVQLVRFFNKIGLTTKMSCQGHDKPVFRIWFDNTDEKIDEKIESFIEKTSQWTEVGIRPVNKERTKWETYRYCRGLRGWFMKKVWYPVGKYRKEEWIYQTEGRTVEEAIMNSQRDLATMQAIYFDKDLDIIQESQEEYAKMLANEQEEINIKKLKCGNCQH